MPRRWSRERCIRLLALEAAIEEVRAEEARYGPHPGEIWSIDIGGWAEFFRSFSTDRLRTMVADIHLVARKPGRPKGSRRNNLVLDYNVVAAVEPLLDLYSEHQACKIVASQLGVDPDALRMRFRRAQRTSST
jgi:hypothetical protein